MTGLEKYDKELYALDERINRLAISCGLDINDNAIIVSLIKGDYSVCKQGNNPKRQELRGLLMLKYNIEEHCINDLGVNECSEIIEKVNLKMQQHGFMKK